MTMENSTSGRSPAPGAESGFQKESKPAPQAVPVLYFDGVCGLCNGFVDFMMARDKRDLFRFATLQGKAGEAAIRDFAAATGKQAQEEGELRSFLLRQGKTLHWKSDAVLLSLQNLGGPWRAVGLLRILPAGLRNLFYDFVAKHRYGWFGKKETCRLPTPAERARFLD